MSGMCGCSKPDILSNVDSALSGAESQLESLVEGESGDEEKSNNNTFSAKDSIDLKADTKIIGNDDYGYMRIPSDFERINDVEGNDNLQYSDKKGSTVFTLNKIPIDIGPAEAFINLKSKLEQDGAVDIETETDTALNSYFGNKISCYFKDEDKYVLIYFIPFSDRIAYIAVEYALENENLTDYTKTWQPFEIDD